MKHLRHFTSVLTIVLIAVLAAGTVAEKLHGSDFARAHVYSAWWFVALLAVFGIVVAILTFSNRNWKRPAVLPLFAAMACIMVGALLTMLTGQHGKIKLEPDRPCNHFFIQEGEEITKEPLPFSLTLDHFEIETYPDSKKPKDYVSYLKLNDGETQQDIVISMNNILKHRHYRFYQSDYDEQGNSILEVAKDPWGIAVTYLGYAFLLIGLITMLLKQQKTYKIVTFSWLSVLVVLIVVLHVRMLTRPLMPVLRSPMFSLHISTIVTAYALLLSVLVVGIIAVVTRFAKPSEPGRLERLRDISMAMLYPAVALLSAGIFIGAVWANISWGNYWSWDPKEVWALITLLVYTMPLFPNVLRSFQKPMFFHIYCILAIFSVVITYFGVNLLLGGVHAYN